MSLVPPWSISPHFPNYFSHHSSPDPEILSGLFEIRNGLKSLLRAGLSGSSVRQSFRGVIGSFWEARALRYFGQGALRPWSVNALREWPAESTTEPPAGTALCYEHSIPITIIADALLSQRCDDPSCFKQALARLVVPCIITRQEDTATRKTRRYDGRSLRDNMPPPYDDVHRLRPLDWPPDALNARYNATNERLARDGEPLIQFPDGTWPSDVSLYYY